MIYQLFLKKWFKTGLLYKIATLDYLCGQVDRHAGNLMLDDGHQFKLIDAGSSFAGSTFAPGKDPKSFIPYYLRVFSPRKFTILTPKERYNSLPQLTAAADAALKAWVDTLNDGQIINILHQYQINPQPVMDRLKAMRDYPGPKYEFLNKFYTNLIDNGVTNENNTGTIGQI